MVEKRPHAKELRAMPEADLKAQLEIIRRELWQQRLKVKDGSLQQTHHLRTGKRQIARILTVLAQHRSGA